MDKENANAGEEDDQPESKATPHSPLYSTPGAKRPNPFKVHLTDIHVCTDNLAHSCSTENMLLSREAEIIFDHIRQTKLVDLQKLPPPHD